MHTIHELMSSDHRACDERFAAVEQAVAGGRWEEADAAFRAFGEAMRRHFSAEESVLFPAFEARTGMRMGPTQVMRGEHAQMNALIAAAETALAQRDESEYSGFAETLLIMMQQHNMKEENILYPMCDGQLGDAYPALCADLAGQLRGA